MGVLKTVATFGLVGSNNSGGNNNTPIISLNIVRGSVVDFTAPTSDKSKNKRIGAIVNAANERCLGGGGVDGAINNAGGKNLWKDREELPVVQIITADGTRRRRRRSSSDSASGAVEIRCPTGDAVITGPNNYGSLKVPYVIHAVGPIYFQFPDNNNNNNNDDDSSGDENNNNEINDNNNSNSNEFSVPDSLLRSAYQNSLRRCNTENNITDVGFSLLSAGIFRGNRSQEDVLRIGIIAIRDYIIDTDATTTLEYGDCVTTIPDDPKKEKEGEKETGSEPSQEEKKEQCENKDVDGISNNIASAAYPHKLRTITLCGFTREEITLLLKICNEIFNNNNSNNNNNNIEEDNEKNNNDDDKNEKNPSK